MVLSSKATKPDRPALLIYMSTPPNAKRNERIIKFCLEFHDKL